MSKIQYRDPWAPAHAWKKHPIFTSRYQLRNAFPGLGIAIVAFTGYVIYDNYLSSSDKSSSKH